MYSKRIKPFLDFIIALIAAPFVGLIVVFVAPFIYFQDRGPVFYTAPRFGKNGKVFKMYKLRSMIVDAPDLKNADGSTYTGKKDSRVTFVGKILRKTSIDELPQIFNVLKGDMSIVGPRPTLAKKSFDEVNPESLRRYNVRPGITGYSQAYLRNSVTTEEKYKNDIYYVDNISFVMDVKIIWQSVVSVLGCKNIYAQENIDNTYDAKEESLAE